MGIFAAGNSEYAVLFTTVVRDLRNSLLALPEILLLKKAKNNSTPMEASVPTIHTKQPPWSP
jgi:hypothetical protein